ncbi:MCE family protein [Nocardioides marmoribigeumensis]|uniref:Phospholipid/cholesterol/gamma-HCH transport system substrate-binding protein n=1 Tax=Nocardioides marmoribigeumensis TaxID=433649 RepID=A0ABU2BZZ9_9ACTN|nr:MCE family protein [Nocardioides marmoribigeumensis]MDR7363961.1 phospholipid/cholesterol/gamma-HCH transport system substrate-binding protein [Nocardioides marmoribigeumensis]
MSGALTPRARVGLYGSVALVLLVLLTQRLDALAQVLRGGDHVTAYFTDSTGLSPGDRVEVSGIAVGRVTSVDIDGPRIRVEARVDDPVRLGDRTTAAIKVGNLLGSKYLELEPAGQGTLAGAIPTSRTTPAYDVVQAVSDLSDTVEEIDTRQLAQALDTVASTFRGAGPDVRRAVSGVSRLSRVVASRDEELRSLLSGTETVVASLDDSKESLSRFVRAASLLMAEVDRQRDTISRLIDNSLALSREVRGLVRDNEEQIRPALANITRVVDLLRGRQAKLAQTVHNLATFARVFVDTIGSGPWFDSYLANVPDQVSTTGPER